MVLIQHLYGIKSLRQTVKEIDMNIAYRLKKMAMWAY